jgi:hypothetical protein
VAGLIGVGTCPENAAGHVWGRHDSRRACVFCGRPGRDNSKLGEAPDTGGFFAQATAARYDVFAGLAAPMVSGSGKPRELTEAQRAKVEEIIADKKRRDAEAVAAGTARPGQIAGAPKGRS